MQHLPIGIHSFERIRQENRLYIDKTQYIHQLITTNSVYFLSRPRRFGKSLLVSTLAAIFAGRRDLFTGLWIADQSDYPFEPYPIFQIDMSRERITDDLSLQNHILRVTDETADQYGVELTYDTYTARFSELLRKLSDINPVVVLIDEYDKPILDNLDKPNRDDIKEALKGFYSTIKASDPYLHFVLLTGVTKFSKISVFSGLNNLLDISMDTRYAELLGITQNELEQYFDEWLARLATSENLNRQDLLDKIRYWYNGYRFSIKERYLYNPFSTLLLLDQQQFRFHWFETGTPTFLIELVKKNAHSWSHIYEPKLLSERAFTSYEIERLDPLPLLFQTGYFTIKDTSRMDVEYLYELDYPNYEVRKSFLAELLDSFSEIYASESYIYRLVNYFRQGAIENVLTELRIFFANVPYELHLKNEKYYQSIFFAIFELLGFNIQAEVRTNRGRIDAVVETADRVYIFEFKLFGTKEEALEQIKTNRYFEKYQHLNKEILLLGVEFDQSERNLGEWLIETV